MSAGAPGKPSRLRLGSPSRGSRTRFRSQPRCRVLPAEESGFIDDDLTIQAMWDKRRQATYIVSNLCFDVRVVKRWIARVRKRGVPLPIFIGMAGVADPAKLLRVSTRIGIADSARFLRGHTNWLMRLIQPGGYSPDRFATGLMPELARPDMKVAGIHVFTFNEIEPTEQWRQQMLARLS